METKKLSLEKLKDRLKPSNQVRDKESVKGGIMADCHQLPPDMFIGAQHITGLPR